MCEWRHRPLIKCKKQYITVCYSFKDSTLWLTIHMNNKILKSPLDMLKSIIKLLFSVSFSLRLAWCLRWHSRSLTRSWSEWACLSDLSLSCCFSWRIAQSSGVSFLRLSRFRSASDMRVLSGISSDINVFNKNVKLQNNWIVVFNN